DKHTQDRHDSTAQHDNPPRVHPGGSHLTDDSLTFFQELRNLVENGFKHTTNFTGAYHVHVKANKNFRMLGQSIRERSTRFNVFGYLTDLLVENYGFYLLAENGQRFQDGQTSINKRGELAGKHHDVLGFNAVENTANTRQGKNINLRSLSLFNGDFQRIV